MPSQMEMMEKALTTVGLEAKNDDLKEWLKNHFKGEFNEGNFNNYKTVVKKKLAERTTNGKPADDTLFSAKPDRMAEDVAAAVNSVVNHPTPLPAPAKPDVDPVRAVRAARALIEAAGGSYQVAADLLKELR